MTNLKGVRFIGFTPSIDLESSIKYNNATLTGDNMVDYCIMGEYLSEIEDQCIKCESS
jgi:hypothetical protein